LGNKYYISELENFENFAERGEGGGCTFSTASI